MTRQETARRGCSHAARFSAAVPRYMVRERLGYFVADTGRNESQGPILWTSERLICAVFQQDLRWKQLQILEFWNFGNG
jgi:hypothetical protein